MPPRAPRRQMPVRMSRSPQATMTSDGALNDPTLWPEEGSETDPEYMPSEPETETETETDDDTDDDDTASDTDTDIDTSDSDFSDSSDE